MSATNPADDDPSRGDGSAVVVVTTAATARPVDAQAIVVLGVVHAVIGAVLLVWPGPTLTVAVAVLGIGLLAAGVVRILLAALDESGDPRTLRVVLGLVGVVAGLLVMRDPLRSLEVVVTVVGVFWVLWALVELFVSLTREAEDHRGALLLEAAVVGLSGTVLLAWPDVTLTVLTRLTGFLLLLIGAVGAWVGWQLVRDVRSRSDDDLAATGGGA